jgi:hypothetical protein
MSKTTYPTNEKRISQSCLRPATPSGSAVKISSKTLLSTSVVVYCGWGYFGQPNMAVVKLELNLTA